MGRGAGGVGFGEHRAQGVAALPQEHGITLRVPAALLPTALEAQQPSAGAVAGPRAMLMQLRRILKPRAHARARRGEGCAHRRRQPQQLLLILLLTKALE